jgi:signal transduction histidine kinase
MLNRKRILIVEDDDLVKGSLARLLQGTDYLVDTATSGEEGLAKYSLAPHDLILTDLHLPGINGIEMISRIREVNKDVPFIVLSAYEEFEEALSAMQLAAVDFFQKPFNAQRILTQTTECLQNHQLKHPLADSSSQDRNISEMIMDDNLLLPTDLLEKKTEPEIKDVYSLFAPFVSLGQQFNGIAHNLNGPLTGMMGHLELLKIRHPELDEDLDTIMKLAKRLRDTIAYLQTKFENETMREIAPQNINQILRAESVFLQSDLFYKHYIERSMELTERLPTIRGVYSDFALAFEQIMINAVDVQREQRAGSIKIRTYQEDEAIHITFEDDGPGFTPESLDHAFDPFWPRIQILEEGNVRMGLGLYMVKHWVEPYHGQVRISNHDPRGARVHVILPLKGGKSY